MAKLQFAQPLKSNAYGYTMGSIYLWKNDPPDIVSLTCLMPNGLMLQMPFNIETTIREVKVEMVALAKSKPLGYVIKDPCDYTVYGISDYNIEPYTDETKRLIDVQPYFGLLSLGDRMETSSFSSDYELTKMVSDIIGKSFDHQSTQITPEVDHFRRKVTVICDNIKMERSKYSWQQRLLYEHPLRLANSTAMPELIRQRHPTSAFLIVVKNENDQSTFTLSVLEHDTPYTLIENTLQKMNRSQMKMNDRANDYILKVSGRDEYLFGDHPLIQFLYIQETLSDAAVPNVVLQSVMRLESYINHYNEQSLCLERQPKPERQSAVALQKTPTTMLWDLHTQNFSLTLHGITNVNFDRARAFKVGVHVGLYHGEHKLCAHRSVDASSSGNSPDFFFDQVLEFDLQMRMLPRMTRLCIVVFEVTKMSRSKKSSNNSSTLKDISYNNNPLAWVNTTLFDYKHQLHHGRHTLYTWTYADDIQSDEVLHPLGTVESNPRKDGCAVVHLTFHPGENSSTGEHVCYPSEEQVLQFAAERARAHREKQLQLKEPEKPLRDLGDILANYTGRDKIYEMVDQDRNAMWERR
ncbi:phosphatidylinositol 4,5-bisphosphate 3-kinase catalytic subunit delta isoform isoform X2 [Drosophila innubila]|nr:phosphatidylinositol 4,5-bisphosphate 3-kinase catalytic subunit delta isoform isoform X2 [Drosophila innubila]